MNPETENRIKTLESQVQELTRLLAGFSNPSEVSPEVKNSLENVLDFTLVATSGTAASANNQAVNEGGAATYSVLGTPDGYFTINGKDVPYFN